jgi:hypothetical protein
MHGVAYARWLSVSGIALAVACGGAKDDGLFGGEGGSAGSAAGSGGSGGSAGSAGGSGGTVSEDSGLGGGPSGAGGGGTGGGGTGGSAGAAGSAGTGGNEGYTLDNVCEKLPKANCSARANCCGKSGVGYNETECVQRETASCSALVEAVKQGARTFHPEKIDACLAALQPLLDSCLFSGEHYVAYLKMVNTCIGIFEGQSGPGSPCTSDFDCAPSSHPAGFAGCSSQSGQCFQGIFVQQGESCSGGYCDEGLTCTYPGGSPTCLPKVPQGSPCTASSQCGYGFYCPQASGTCQPALPGGSNCGSDLHCKSLDCTNFYNCTQQPAYVDAQACGL